MDIHPTPPTLVTDQRRDAVRVGCPDAIEVVLWVQSSAEVGFDAPLVEIGVGGCSFVWPAEVPPLAEGAPLELTFHWCEARPVVRQAVLLRRQTLADPHTGHVGFVAANQEASQATGALVTFIERVRLRLQRNASPHETENLAELYRAGPGRCPRC